MPRLWMVLPLTCFALACQRPAPESGSVPPQALVTDVVVAPLASPVPAETRPSPAASPAPIAIPTTPPNAVEPRPTPPIQTKVPGSAPVQTPPPAIGVPQTPPAPSTPATPPAATKPAPATPGPSSLVLKSPQGDVTLTHRLHEDRLGCAPCHGEGTPGALPLGKEKAHPLCKGCHQAKAAGPVKCPECHKKP